MNNSNTQNGGQNENNFKVKRAAIERIHFQAKVKQDKNLGHCKIGLSAVFNCKRRVIKVELEEINFHLDFDQITDKN